jgi:hypothetical protein
LSAAGLVAKKQQRLDVNPDDHNLSEKHYGNLKNQGSLVAKISNLKCVC